MPAKIIIKGAREHNLKNIDLEIPRDQLVVITGVSGSGKSSLAFDTLYAEGQRRYVESLSAYARQFLEQMQRPDVDSIDGLSPAISIEQKSAGQSPRSTVGTVTEIYDHLRLLFARAGSVECYQCGREITAQTVQQIVDQLLALPRQAQLHVLAPIVAGRKGEYRRELKELSQAGFARVKIDGNDVRRFGQRNRVRTDEAEDIHGLTRLGIGRLQVFVGQVDPLGRFGRKQLHSDAHQTESERPLPYSTRHGTPPGRYLWV